MDLTTIIKKLYYFNIPPKEAADYLGISYQYVVGHYRIFKTMPEIPKQSAKDIVDAYFPEYKVKEAA